MLPIDGVHTLSNVIIIEPTRIDLVSQATISHGIEMTIMIQTKDDLYHNQFPMDMFFSLVEEVFECLH